MGAVTSYLSAHPGVQCAASDLIHICAYGSVGQYQQLSLAKYVSDYFYISYLFDLLTHKHISVSFLLTQVIK